MEGQAEKSNENQMRISEASRLSGVSTRLIRYYESIQLLGRPARTATGYRDYDQRDVHELRFIKRARSLGFSLKQTKELLDLWRDTRRANHKVLALAERHQRTIIARMQAHEAIIEVLGRLIQACQSNDRPECPILDGLADSRSRE
ncbi:MAG: MerR family transcriptional regulator [Methylotetracoccus sp.]|nr:MerR family transcriptional regulator [Methylotetracoccus sp.]